MKRLGLSVLLMLLVSFVAFIPVSVGVEEEYRADCPDEAKAILDAVGGCDAIDCSKYPAICEKCCLECEEESPTACKTKEECEALGLYWYDDECNAEEPETASSPSSSESTPGFGAVFAVAGLLALASLLKREK